MFMVVARAETEPNKINYTSIKDSLNNNNNKLVFTPSQPVRLYQGDDSLKCDSHLQLLK